MLIKLTPYHKELFNRIGVNYHEYVLINETADNLKLKHRVNGKILNVRY